MLALVILASAAVFGWGAVRRLGWTLTRLETIALGGAIALTAAPWLLFLAAWQLGFGAGVPLACAALAGGGYALGRGRPIARDGTLPATSSLSWIALAVLFGLLFHGHMFHAEAGGLYTGGSSYGDLALHATLVEHFASRGVDLQSPIVAGAPLTYPFLGDFAVACLVRGGLSLSAAFALSGWITAMIGLALIQAVTIRMFRSRAAGTLAVWMIVLSGSAAGVWYAAHDLIRHGLPADLGALPSYSHDRARGMAWSNIVADFLLPQRAFLAALPAAWAALWALRAGFEDRTPRAPLAAALAIGALPLFHIHSFLMLFGLLALIAVWQSVRAPATARSWWLAVAGAVALAAPQLVWQFGGSWHKSFGHARVGWIAPHGGFWWFWLRSWGVVLLLVPAVAVATWRRGAGGFAAPLLVGALAVFAAANLYQFQPHDWDNMKFLLYAFMFVVVLAAGLLARGLDTWPGRAATTAAVIAATLAGALTVARELDLHDQLASAADLHQAAELRAVVPADGLVLTSDQHNHVVPMLAGRAIVMGYRGWLWTHGIDYSKLERDVRAMFAGGARVPSLLRRYHVTHVYIGPGERRDFGADPAWYRARYPTALALDGVEVFDVRAPRPPALARR